MNITKKIKNVLANKNKLKAIFIDDTGHMVIKKVYYQNKYFEMGSGHEAKVYVVDKNRVYWHKKDRSMVAFYNENDPTPIDMAQANPPKTTGRNLKSIVDSKVVTDLFSTSEDLNLKIIMFASIIAALTGIVILLQMLGIVNLKGA